MSSNKVNYGTSPLSSNAKQSDETVMYYYYDSPFQTSDQN
jgi:hypothetical protein